MPKGVYDRTKSKEQREEEKKAGAKKAEKAPKAAAVAKEKAPKAVKVKAAKKVESLQKAEDVIGEAGPRLQNLAREPQGGMVDTFGLSRTAETLLHIRTVVGSGSNLNSTLVAEIDGALTKIVTKLDESLTEKVETVQSGYVAVQEEKAEEKAEEPVLTTTPAPVAQVPVIAAPVPVFTPAPVVTAPVPFNPPPASVQS